VYYTSDTPARHDRNATIGNRVNWRIDGRPALWEYGEIKTALELPDELMRRVKLRAVHRTAEIPTIPGSRPTEDAFRAARGFAASQVAAGGPE